MLPLLPARPRTLDPADVIRALREARDAGAAPRSIYVHVPFCFHKCHYCDFYSIVDGRNRQPAFTDRLIDELRSLAPLAGAPIETIFVGGGTPTLLAIEHWRRLLAVINECFRFATGAEFTVEANPETVTPELIEMLVAGGVNRMSVGAQSFDERHLKSLERWHDPRSVGRAVELIRAGGVGDINIDLIFGIPGQTLDEWLADLRRALELGPDHLSCYSLTYEPNTAMTARLAAGEFEPADESLEAEMFAATAATLRAAGLHRYEISNFAQPGHECRHNLVYWRDGDWFAAGPSASGHAAGCRWKNAPALTPYLDSSGPAPIVEFESQGEATRLAERLLMGLRLVEGVDIGEIRSRAASLGAGDELDAAVACRVAHGEMSDRDGRWRIEEHALLFADSIIAGLMAAVDP